MRLPTAAQVGTVLQAADDAFRPFVALCAFADLRLGGAAAVRVEDIDFLRRSLTVARQVQRAGRVAVEVQSPQYGSERSVFLAPALVDLLAAHVAATARPAAGCSPAPARTRRTRTSSATGGAPSRPPPACQGCGCMASSTSTPRVSSTPAATS
ncbi:hypothetical protein [Modestobacter sp. DSM 44400]|uniref:hypothetical protein n=1 Tax=Modestobacter sp. DSM 44400 TaxID=1550230 RepID=UPI0015876E98|nr:hypothetical protein [Modestobacter sp. DSM 44400]